MEDYISAGADIHHVTYLTREAFRISSDNQESSPLLRLYFENALITYARPFATGVRLRLSPDNIFGDKDDAISYHRHLIQLRNKLVAHNVNPFENVVVGVFLGEEGEVAGVGHLMGRLVGFTKDDYRQFNALANVVLDFINTKLQSLEDEVLKEARQLSPDQLLKLQPVRFTTPGQEMVSKPKKNR